MERSGVREQLDQTRSNLDTARAAASVLQSTVATVTAERGAARADADRERRHAEVRVADLRTAHEQQLQQLKERPRPARQRTSSVGIRSPP